MSPVQLVPSDSAATDGIRRSASMPSSRDDSTRPDPRAGSARGRRAAARRSPEGLAVGVGLARAEDLDGHARAAGRPAVAAPAGDRQVPDVVLQPPFAEDVVPESDALDQFTLGVAQPRDPARPAVRPSGSRAPWHCDSTLVQPPDGRQISGECRRLSPMPRVVDPEPEAPARVASGSRRPVEVLVGLRLARGSRGSTVSSCPTQSPSSMGTSASGPLQRRAARSRSPSPGPPARRGRPAGQPGRSSVSRRSGVMAHPSRDV